MGYKVTIVLVWLALPLAALLLLRTDYERYEHEVEVQREYAEARRDMLLRYSMLFDNRGREVLAIADPQSRKQWEQRLRELAEQLEAEEKALGNPGLSHFPATSQILSGAEQQIKEQQANLRDAGRLQDAYAKSKGNMDDLRMQVLALTFEADRARMFGAWDIFMQYQELIARIEGVINQRLRRRSDINNDLTLAMSQANSHRSELRRLLSGVSDALAKDDGRTYREDLVQRFANFNLRATITQLATGSKPAQAAQAK